MPEQEDNITTAHSEPETAAAANAPEFKQIQDSFRKGMAEFLSRGREPPGPKPPGQPGPPEENGAKPAPSAKAGAPADEAKPAAEEPVPAAIKSPKAQEEFKKLMRDRDGWRSKFNELLEKMEKEPKPDPELISLRSERDRLAGELERVALERSPSFRQRHQAKLDRVRTAVKRLAGEKAELAEKLLSEPPSKSRSARLEELAGGLGAFEKLQLAASFNEHDMAMDDMQYELENHRATIAMERENAKISEQSRAAQAAAVRKQMISDVLQMAGGTFKSFTRNDDPAHNALVAENEADVRKFIMGEVDEGASAILPVLANEALYLQRTTIPGLEARIKELEAQLVKYGSASPRPSAAGASNPASQGLGVDGMREEGSFKARLKKDLAMFQAP
jgi:hypothetical protein